MTVAPTAPSAIVPPQNLEAEESVLGAMLLSATAIGAVTEVVSASDFYRESHGTIYQAALALYGKGEPVDAITLANELDERSELERVGGTAKIAELAAVVPATSNAEHYARIVKEMATLRGLVRVGQEIQRLGQTRPGATTDLVDRAEQMVFELAQQRVSGDFAHIHDLLNESFARIMHLYEAGVDVTGVPSGFRELDKLTSGFQPGNLVIIAARPSMGKSALALCTAANLAVRHETPVALFTLEMSKSEVTQRLMCSEAKVESQRLRSGRLAQDDWPRLTAACDKLMKAPIYVDDTGSITMMELRSKARRLKSREPKLGMIIVDYLQLMTSGSNPENRVQEVSQISRQLKVLARDLEVPILALSQLSRAVEQRHDKRPILSDLRESGCLAGETAVYLPDEGIHRPIRDLVGTSGFNVLAVNERTWQLEPRPVTNAFATGIKPVYRLTTRRGRTIRATANHKFLAFDRWRRLDELEPGTRIAMPRRLDTWGESHRSMSDPELALLGHLIGDGCTLARHAIQYTTREADLAGLVADLSEEVFGEAVVPRVRRERSYRSSTLYRAGLSRSRAERVADIVDSAGLRRLAQSDVYWDEVVSVVPDGDEEVYDLTVQGLHNFVAANTIVHNSIEQDADLVAFVYRDEYYNGEESDSQGLAEVILAKHRNGPTDSVKLSFLKRYAKFTDLAAAT
ncbi:MAG: replicative DNA helicase [Thermoleophilia bacterium]|nr:replicative DNA helicase [Thermoleophilia bacterium]